MYNTKKEGFQYKKKLDKIKRNGFYFFMNKVHFNTAKFTSMQDYLMISPPHD